MRAVCAEWRGEQRRPTLPEVPPRLWSSGCGTRGKRHPERGLGGNDARFGEREVLAGFLDPTCLKGSEYFMSTALSEPRAGKHSSSFFPPAPLLSFLDSQPERAGPTRFIFCSVLAQHELESRHKCCLETTCPGTAERRRSKTSFKRTQ